MRGIALCIMYHMYIVLLYVVLLYPQPIYQPISLNILSYISSAYFSYVLHCLLINHSAKYMYIFQINLKVTSHLCSF